MVSPLQARSDLYEPGSWVLILGCTGMLVLVVSQFVDHIIVRLLFQWLLSKFGRNSDLCDAAVRDAAY